MDAITGGLYNLTPEQIAGQLSKQGASLEQNAEGIRVVLVRDVDPSWQRIGTLQR